MKREYKLFTYKEQIFLISISFFTIMSLISAFFSKGNSSWAAITLCSLVITLVSYIKYPGAFIRKVGLYIIIFPFLPLCWYNNFFDLVPNTIYTILIFVLINALTKGKERVILNILVASIIEIVFITIYMKQPQIKVTELRNYILKWIVSLPFITSALILIIHTIKKSRDLEKKEQILREQTLMQQSITDHLTGLYNRSYMEQKLKSSHNIWRRGFQAYSIIMLDVDYFKKYNDYYGHIQGDECLRKIGTILQDQLNRDTDYAFRYGGEEFLILLNLTDGDGARLIAQKIQKSINDAAIPHAGSDVSTFVTTSIGIGTVDKNSSSFEQLIENTDKALYNAKRSGRNKIVNFTNQVA